MNPRSKRQADYLRNKCRRALRAWRLPGNQIDDLIVDAEYLNRNRAYLSALASYKDRYAYDPTFREGCLDTSRWVLMNRLDTITIHELEIAVDYLLAELPMFFNSAAILGKKEAIFCYRDCPAFIRGIFEKREDIVPDNQGHVIVDVEGP